MTAAMNVLLSLLVAAALQATTGQPVSSGFKLGRLRALVADVDGDLPWNEEDSSSMSFPSTIGLSDEVKSTVSSGKSGKSTVSSGKSGKEPECDITLFPNLNTPSTTSFVTADGTVSPLSDGFPARPDDLTGSRFLIPGNPLFYDIEETKRAGKYIGSFTYLESTNGFFGSITQDLLTVIVDGEGTLAAFGYTKPPEPEQYIITGGTGEYVGRTGTMTITDRGDGIPFCIKVSF